MQATLARLWKVSNFVMPALNIALKAFAMPFLLLVIIAFARMIGLIEQPDLEGLRTLAAAFASADRDAIQGAVKVLFTLYVTMVFVSLALLMAFAPRRSDDDGLDIGNQSNRFSTWIASAALKLYDALPDKWSTRRRNIAVVLVMCLTTLLLLELATVRKQADMPFPPALVQGPQKPPANTWASVLLPDGTVLRGTAEIRPGSEPMTYVVTLTAHSK